MRGQKRGKLSEMFLFLFMAAGIYLALAILDSSWAGQGGRALGMGLRATFGGALIIPVLFCLYLSLARFSHSRVPHPLGQLLGTVQLYLSLAFMLGLARRSGWNPGWAILDPGSVGGGLARFFILNIGTLGTILTAMGSFLLAAFFFHSRLLANISSSIASSRPPSQPAPPPPAEKPLRREPRPQDMEPPVPPSIVWPDAAAFTPSVQKDKEENPLSPPQAQPTAQPAPAAPQPEPVSTPKNILNDLLASFEAGAFSAPESLLAEREPQPLPARGEPRRSVPLTDDAVIPIIAGPQPLATSPREAAGERVRPEESNSGALALPLNLFGPPAKDEGEQEAQEEAERQGAMVVETLRDFGVDAAVAHVVTGPSVIQFQLELAPGTKVNKVSGLANELTMALAVVSVRIEAPIPGKPYVGVEIPNPKRRAISLRSVMESQEFQSCDALLPLPMGMQVDSRFLVTGLEDMPHLLVAGTTGSGKSVFVNCCILGMCSRRTPDDLKLILIDPKRVEFAIYEGLPHLLAHPVSDSRRAIDALAWAVQEMESRMEDFAGARVRSLAAYNRKVLPKDRLPNIVVVVDELADLMYTAGKEAESHIVRLAQKARAAGIHLILATQRPSVDVITGLIKANVPARAAFALPAQTDSRTILDAGGADQLLGRGDMLFLSTRHPRPVRLQSPFVTEECTLDVVEYLKAAFGERDTIEFPETFEENGSRGRRSRARAREVREEE